MSQSAIQPSTPFAQLGGATEGLIGRVKDFEVLCVLQTGNFVIVTASSDGSIRLWAVSHLDLLKVASDFVAPNFERPTKDEKLSKPETSQIGQILGTYEAGNRITCLVAFLMNSPQREATTNGFH